MLFKSSTDQWPVLLDRSGNPLYYGKVFFSQLGTTTVPKDVYSDYEATIPVTDRPILCGPGGRLPYQVFLGVGGYTVTTYRYAGPSDEIPTLSSNPDLWAIDNQWDEDGLPVPIAAHTTTLETVDTIEDLRDFDPSTSQNVRVLSYNTLGDYTPRTYYWDPSTRTLDNGGSIIASNVSSAGRWRLKIGNTDVVDSRTFGIFPGGADCYQSLLSMINAVNGASETPQALYFSPGIYTISGTSSYNFVVKAIFDSATWNKTDAGTVEFLLSSDSVMDVASLTDATSTGAVLPRFTSATVPIEVRPRWWKLPGATNDGACFLAMASSITTAAKALIDTALTISTMATSVTIRRAKFTAAGSLSMGTTSSTNVIFRSIEGPASFYGSGLDRLIFKCPIRSSWFEDLYNTGYTVDLTPLIATYNLTSPEPTIWYLDHIISYFDTSMVASQNARFIFKADGGHITVSGTNTILLTNSDFGTDWVVRGRGVYLQDTTYIQNFMPGPGAATSGQSDNAFIWAMRSAVMGSGELDLCGRSIFVTSETILSSATSYSLWVHNGTLFAYGKVIRLASGYNCVRVSDLVVNGLSSAMLVDMTSSAPSIGMMWIDNVTFSPSSSGNSHLIHVDAGYVAYVNVSRSQVDCDYIMDADIGGTITLANNLKLNGDLIHSGTVLASGNKVSGGLNKAWRLYETMLSGNRFYECSLYLNSVLAKIYPVVSGNQFESTDAHPSKVYFQANQGHSILAGANVSGNSFTGSVTSQVVCIDKATGGSGTFATKADPGLLHKFCVSNNIGANYYLIAPVTRGTPSAARLHVTIGGSSTTTQKKTDYYMLDSDPSVFYIEDSPVLGTVHSLSALRMRRASSNRVVRSLAFNATTETGIGTEFTGVMFESSDADSFVGDKAAEVEIDLY